MYKADKSKWPKTVDEYLEIGCMRCELGNTPQCKVHNWRVEIEACREIALECGLVEEIKWAVPCYTLNSKNVIIISALKDEVRIGFFKGALLKDETDILDKLGENTQADRIIRVKDTAWINDKKVAIKDLIFQAIELEKRGLQYDYKKDIGEYPDELRSAFVKDPTFEDAFEKLTPGRKRSYLLHFNGAKQSKTKVSRIEKAKDKIFSGKGFNEY
ncbi:MAG: YdeI family protein [Candidatus Kapaibacteriales bacterium]